MLPLALLVLMPAQFPTVESEDFSAAMQAAALSATVRVVNTAGQEEGSGAIIGQSGPFVYLLTALHVVSGAERVEVHTFSAASFPKPDTVYRSAEVVARGTKGIDVALVRIASRDPVPGSVRICPPRRLTVERAFPVLTTGCSDGLAPTCQIDDVASKKLVRKEGQEGSSWFWETRRPAVRGRSGGPLLDRHGQLIGVCSFSSGKGYYSHVDDVRTMLTANAFKWLIEEPR